MKCLRDFEKSKKLREAETQIGVASFFFYLQKTKTALLLANYSDVLALYICTSAALKY